MNPPEFSVSRPGVQELIERHLEQNPVVPYYLRTGDAQAVTISDFLTKRQFHRLALYNEWYRSLGVEYQLSVPIPTSADTLARVSLSRDRRDFSDRERLLLSLLGPHLLEAYRNAEAHTRLLEENTRLKEGLRAERREILSVASGDHLAETTVLARQWLVTYLGGSPRRPNRLRASLREWIRHQHALLDGPDDAPPPRRPLVVERNGTRLVVRLLPAEHQDLLLLEEQPTSPAPGSLASLGLTRREAEVLTWVAQGKTNEEIAKILGISLRTVTKHLEMIYPKLGVENRTAAAAQALAVLSAANE